MTGGVLEWIRPKVIGFFIKLEKREKKSSFSMYSSLQIWIELESEFKASSVYCSFYSWHCIYTSRIEKWKSKNTLYDKIINEMLKAIQFYKCIIGVKLGNLFIYCCIRFCVDLHKIVQILLMQNYTLISFDQLLGTHWV